MQAADVIKQLKSIADPERAKSSQRFFKTGKGEYGEGDVFIGIRVPILRQKVQQFKELSLAETEQLLQSPYHEARLLALFLLVKKFSPKRSTEKEAVYKLYMRNLEFVNNWDLVDSSAHHITGAWLEDKDRSILYKLAHSDDLWEKRVSMIATYWYIRNSDFKDAFAIGEILLNDKHDLIHKAVGWMLREAGERDGQAEREFLKKHYKVMPRTMLRYAIEKFPEEERQSYLKGTA